MGHVAGTTPRSKRVRTTKVMGLANLPSKSWETNASWMLTVNLTADLDAWLRLLTLHDQPDLAEAEPDTMRFRLYHLPARLARHVRRRFLRIERDWPWGQPFTTSWQRIHALTAVTEAPPSSFPQFSGAGVMRG